MTDKELAAAFAALRAHCLNIIGFHGLAEDEGPEICEAQRVMYAAYVYADGVALAHRVFQLADELEQKGER